MRTGLYPAGGGSGFGVFLLARRSGVIYHGGMAVFLDDEPLEVSGGDLAAVLEAAQRRLKPEGRIVVEVQWEGRTLDSDQLRAHRHQPVEGVEVRLYSAEPGELALEALDQLRERLEASGQSLEQAAEAFQSDRPDEGMRLLAQGLDIWQRLPQAIMQVAELLGIDLAKLDPAVDVAAATEELAERLRLLRDQVQVQDTLALADTLAYEWPGIVEKWQGFIEQIIRQIET